MIVKVSPKFDVRILNFNPPTTLEAVQHSTKLIDFTNCTPDFESDSVLAVVDLKAH